MKRLIVALAMMGLVTTGACGGSSTNGGGGGLTAAQVAAIYGLAYMGTPVDQALPAILAILGTNCTATASNVSIATDGICDGDGTWAVTGTANCQLTGTGLTINSTSDSTLVLSGCQSTVFSADVNAANGDGSTVTLTGTINPFSMSNTTITGDMAIGDIVITGSATMGYSDMQVVSTETATVSFTQTLIFTAFDPDQPDSAPTCGVTTVTATQGAESGTCTTDSTCNCS